VRLEAGKTKLRAYLVPGKSDWQGMGRSHLCLPTRGGFEQGQSEQRDAELLKLPQQVERCGVFLATGRNQARGSRGHSPCL
jgi:hypothetical protein